MLTSKQRAFLRGEAQTLEPVVLVGKGGVSEALIADADTAISAKELIKGAVLENCPLTAREAADALAEGLSADVVQVIGRRFVLFRESKEEEKQRFYHWYNSRNLVPTIQKLKNLAAVDVTARMTPFFRSAAMGGEEKAELESEIEGACARMMNNLLFSMREQLPNHLFEDCLTAMEQSLTEKR